MTLLKFISPPGLLRKKLIVYSSLSWCTSCIDYPYDQIKIPEDQLSEVELAMRVVGRVLEKSTIDSAVVLRERLDDAMEDWRIIYPGSDSIVIAKRKHFLVCLFERPVEEKTVLFHFTDVLKDKYVHLKAIGGGRLDIAILMIYEYENICNLEFTPEEMALMGRNGISFGLSCFQVG